MADIICPLVVTFETILQGMCSCLHEEYEMTEEASEGQVSPQAS